MLSILLLFTPFVLLMALLIWIAVVIGNLRG